LEKLPHPGESDPFLRKPHGRSVAIFPKVLKKRHLIETEPDRIPPRDLSGMAYPWVFRSPLWRRSAPRPLDEAGSRFSVFVNNFEQK